MIPNLHKQQRFILHREEYAKMKKITLNPTKVGNLATHGSQDTRKLEES